MKKNTIVYSVLILVAVLVFAISSKNADAVPITITGDISIGFGAVEAVGGGPGQDGTMWDIATGIHFVPTYLDNNNVLHDAMVAPYPLTNGDFTAIAPFTLVDFNDFTFSPSLSPSPILLWETFDGPPTASFEMTTVYYTNQTATTLNLKGTGDLMLTGFEKTAGSWTLALTGLGNTFSFTSTAVASGDPGNVNTNASVPAPGTIILLGIGMTGLVGSGVMRKTKKQVS